MGGHYRTTIYYISQEQKKIAEKSKKQLQKSKKFDKDIETQILPATEFWPAEEYHQQYYRKCPLRYEQYKKASGRKDFIEHNWK